MSLQLAVVSYGAHFKNYSELRVIDIQERNVDKLDREYFLHSSQKSHSTSCANYL